MANREEVNLAISAFMGDERLSQGKYLDSLDALVPVWEKLGKHVVVELCRHEVEGYHWCYFRDLKNNKINEIDEDSMGRTIQDAALHATFKAIRITNRELKAKK